MREKCVGLHKSGNGYKIIATCLKMPISTIRAIFKKLKCNWNCYKLAWKRTHVYFAPTHSEEDDKRGKKFPKDRCWTITEESSILGS